MKENIDEMVDQLRAINNNKVFRGNRRRKVTNMSEINNQQTDN